MLDSALIMISMTYAGPAKRPVSLGEMRVSFCSFFSLVEARVAVLAWQCQTILNGAATR